MGLLKDQDVLHFKDVLRFFSILHAPKPCRGSVKLFHLISWSFHTAELCHPRRDGVALSPPWPSAPGCLVGFPRIQVGVYSSFTEHQTCTGAGAWQSLARLFEVQISSATSPPCPGGVKTSCQELFPL